jgi:flagella basal body P-ring formation protein FlgA
MISFRWQTASNGKGRIMTAIRVFITTFWFIFFVSLGLGTPWSVCATPGAVIDVFRQSEVNRDEICLEDISRVTGDDPGLVRRLRGIEIGRSPLPGKSRRIDGAHILVRLKQFGIDVSQVGLNVPDNAQVVRGVARVPKERVEEVVLAYIRQALPVKNVTVRIKEIQFKNDAILPKGVVTFKVEPPGNRDLSGKVPLAVSIYVGGKLEKKIWAVADIEVLKKVIVAKRPLGRHREITEDDIEVEEMNVAKLPSNSLTDYGDILGKRTRKAIDVRAVLRSDMIEFPPLVKRGDVVMVLAESAAMRITALGVVKEREGREGERILVENLDSKKGIYAQVVDSKTVRVDF